MVGRAEEPAPKEHAVRALSIFEETLCGQRLPAARFRQRLEESDVLTGDRNNQAICYSQGF
jgi:hypothetical protein